MHIRTILPGMMMTVLSLLSVQAQTIVYDSTPSLLFAAPSGVETGVGFADRIQLGGTDRSLVALHLSMIVQPGVTGSLHISLYTPDTMSGGPGTLFATSSSQSLASIPFLGTLDFPLSSFSVDPLVLPEDFYVGVIMDEVDRHGATAALVGPRLATEGTESPGFNPPEPYYQNLNGGAWSSGGLAGSVLGIQIEAIAVPEASTWLLATAALSAFLLAGRRRRMR